MYFYKTPLHLAVENNNLETIQLFLFWLRMIKEKSQLTTPLIMKLRNCLDR